MGNRNVYTALKYGALLLALAVFVSTLMPKETRDAIGPWRDAVGGGVVLACVVVYIVAETGLEEVRRREKIAQEVRRRLGLETSFTTTKS